jgi:NAD(P)-dependent dehydrogenase (short-subunit alcohol dehydrogenase family)
MTHRSPSEEPGGADEVEAAHDARVGSEPVFAEPDRPRTWLITGASRGLGRALALAAADVGDTVIATVRDLADAPVGEGILAVVLDVRDRDAAHAAVAEAVRETGRLDVLVNNAGYGLVGMVEEVELDDALAIVETDMLGPLWSSQAALPVMREQGHGHILQISTSGAVGAIAGLGLYNAAKWGLEGFSSALALEAGAFGVRVTIVQCGALDTGWATSGMRFARPDPAYDELRLATFGTSETPWAAEGTGGGLAPSAAAAAILRYVDEPDGRLRLLVGDDVAEHIAHALQQRIADYRRDPRFPQLD